MDPLLTPPPKWSTGAPPEPMRRIARQVPPCSPTGIVLHVVRAALDPEWSPVPAARRVLARADGDLLVLRRARSRLRTSAGDRTTLVEAKAIATLNIAIGELDEDDDRAELSGGGDGGGRAAQRAI